MQKIRVVVADDQAAMRTGMNRLLSYQTDIEVVGEARDGNEAFTAATDILPDVIVMDLEMPVEGGASATRRIIAQCPQVSIVVVSSSDPHEGQRITAAVGATVFIPKHDCAALLVVTIRQIVEARRKRHDDLAEELRPNYVAPPTAMASAVDRSTRT